MLYYFFDADQHYRILNKNGLSIYSSIYADDQIAEPIYDRLTNKFVVDYNIRDNDDNTIQKSKSFESRGEAIEFYLKQYRTYQYEWTMMFYDEFKNKEETTRNGFHIEDVRRLLSRLQNLQNRRRSR